MSSPSKNSGPGFSATFSAGVLVAASISGCKEKENNQSPLEPVNGGLRLNLNPLELAGTSFSAGLSENFRYQEPAAGAQVILTHTVRAGETLSGIVRKQLGSSSSLAEVVKLNKDANPNFDPDLLRVGQTIILPFSITSSPGPESASSPKKLATSSEVAPAVDYSSNLDFRAMLRYHEGIRNKTYLCPAGKITVGVGRNLSSRHSAQEIEKYINKTFSGDQIESWLTDDIRSAQRDLERVFGKEKWFLELSENRKMVLISMTFVMGVGRVWSEEENGQRVIKRSGLQSFKGMLAALEANDFEAAAKHILDSRFGRNGGNRPHELARMMQDDRMPSIPERFYLAAK